jgi:Cupin superfamily protein
MTLLEVDESQWERCRGRDAFAMSHNLVGDPRLARDSLAALAGRLPEKSLEQNVADQPETLAVDQRDRVPRTTAEIARDFDKLAAWMVLWNIEQDPEYRGLLFETLDELLPSVRRTEGDMLLRQGFIFLSAPGSVTPSHSDPEHNFLLQVEGTKYMTVGRYPDEETEQRELSRKYLGGHRYLAFPPADAETFTLEPGDGAYVPPHAPHMVRNGEGPSVSLSITFKTPATEQADLVYLANAHLRRLRLHPTPPGRNAGADKIKGDVVRVIRGIQRRLP